MLTPQIWKQSAAMRFRDPRKSVKTENIGGGDIRCVISGGPGACVAEIGDRAKGAGHEHHGADVDEQS